MPISPALLPLLVALCLQPPAATPPKPPGPGDPLPHFNLKVKGTLDYNVKDASGKRLSVVNGGFVLLWGDLRLEGERLLADWPNQHLQAFGNVLLRRGDETIQGDDLLLDGASGTITIHHARVGSPPFYFSGERIDRSPTRLLAQNGSVGLAENGKGEIRFSATEIRLEHNERLILRNATVYLYNQRLLRLPHIAFDIDTDPNTRNKRNHNAFSNPIAFRQSQISGAVLGFSTAITPVRSVSGNALLEFTSRQGMQYDISLEHSLLGRQRPEAVRGTNLTAPRPTTPLRQLLTARPTPQPPDPVLDFNDILTSTNALNTPARPFPRSLSVGLSLVGNREYPTSRFGQLLVSRQPEATLSGQVPLSAPLPSGDNATIRHGLRTPRFYLSGQLGEAHLRETRLQEDKAHVTENRTAVTLVAGMRPLLLGDHLLTTTAVTLQRNHYRTGDSYTFFESRVSAAYAFGLQTMVGVAFFKRNTEGATPFFFDRIDTQNEGQIRGQLPISGGRYILAALGRYDLTQGRFFDKELALAIRGTVLEPRFTYHELNRTINFGLMFPPLNTR